MPREEFFSELQIRETELKEELEHIQKLLNGRGEPVSNSNQSDISDTVTSTKTYFGKAKGKTKWRDYVKNVLKGIGGTGKARDVASAIVKANPSVTPKRALDTARHHLSKLHLKGDIKATKGKAKSAGYVYKIK